MNHVLNRDSKGQAKVDQTVQWAREALQRRRSELLEKKGLISSSKDDEIRSLSTTPNDVNSMLERGRALLAQAEAHSEILGQYATSDRVDGASQDSEVDQPTAVTTKADSKHQSDRSTNDFMVRFLQETNHERGNQSASNTCDPMTNTSRVIPNLPVEIPDWANECEEGDRQSREFGDGNEELQELLKEGEARARLDELIATVRRQGDDMPREEEMVETPTKRISSFDPSSMKAAKRATLRRIKLDEEAAAAEEEARLLSSFKALPLPGGAEVNNNIFASTQSFQGKQIGSVEKLLRRDTKCDQLNDTSSSISGLFDGISMVSSTNSNKNSFSFSHHETEEDRERAKQLRAEKKMKKRQLLDTVNRMIMGDIQASPVEDDAGTIFSEGFDIVEDPSKLRQDIVRLEAKLKQKKTQRMATLNDIVDIDLNSLFERLMSAETGENIRQIIDRLKDQVCGSVNDFKITPDVKEITLETNEPKRRSLFRRHVDWAEDREQKLFDARLQLEADAMYDMTGRPEILHSTRSWRRAKESHDETLKNFSEVEERNHKQKEAKEKASGEVKRKEMEELQKQAKSKLKSMKSEVNKEEQTKRLEMLSQPRQIREAPNTIQARMDMAAEEQHNLPSKSEIFLPATPKRKASSMSEKTVKKVTQVPNKKPEEFCDKPSFSEMSDKEFAKLVKKISKNALSKVEGDR